MNKHILVSIAISNIGKRRTAALDANDRVLTTLRTHADWRQNEHDLRVATVAEVMSNTPEQKAQAIAQTKTLTAARNKLLAKYGMSEADLLPQYTCKKCGDTGYADNTPCTCLQAEIRRLLIAESDILHTEYTFDNSTETDEHNNKVYARAKKICDSQHGNILLFGNVGLGKTYLLTACANRCVSLGKSVMFVTAYKLNQTFLECHLGGLATKQAVTDNLTDVDVLVIDDLGTETTYKNVSAEYLFSLLNERLAQGKQTFISTNLTIGQLRDNYDERIFSRLIDQKTNLVAQLNGADKRMSK